MNCNDKFFIGYDRQIVTPELGTGLGGYGNGCDRPTIGKIIEDDDLYITAIAITDNNDKTIIVMTIDLCRMPFGGYHELLSNIEAATGVKHDNIILGATHSHSTPEFIDDVPAMETWRKLFMEMGLRAAQNALADRKPAKAYIGTRYIEGLNFVRRYFKEGKFLGTNRAGDAHETEADNSLQMIKFVRDGGEDVVLVNWAAHPDHSKDIGGAPGTPGYHKGCSADYIYGFRTEFEKLSGAKVAFFQGAAGNLNSRSLIKGEDNRTTARAEKDGVMRFVAYGRELADEAFALYNSELSNVNCYNSSGKRDKIVAQRPKGDAVGSPEYNAAYATCVVTFARRTLEEPTKESLAGAQMLIEKFGLGDIDNVRKIAEDENHPLHTHAVCIKVLTDGGKVPSSNEYTRECALALAGFYKIAGGAYGTNGLLSRSQNQTKPPFDLPLYALSCGDIAFVGAPGEVFDTNGMDVKNTSPFKMTFYLEHCGGAWGYFPSKLAWSHGGYEVDSTGEAEGTAEQISEKLIEMLNELKLDS